MLNFVKFVTWSCCLCLSFGLGWGLLLQNWSTHLLSHGTLLPHCTCSAQHPSRQTSATQQQTCYGQSNRLEMSHSQKALWLSGLKVGQRSLSSVAAPWFPVCKQNEHPSMLTSQLLQTDSAWVLHPQRQLRNPRLRINRFLEQLHMSCQISNSFHLSQYLHYWGLHTHYAHCNTQLLLANWLWSHCMAFERI